MAKKRMFNQEIVDTDLFLDMPTSARLLYYDLGMRADDDGFLSDFKKIIRMTGASQDDLKILMAKSFILPFESGVIVIRHWKLNNYIQKDRYTETIYKKEKAELTIDENCVYNLDTNCIHSIDKISIDKNSIDKNSIDENKNKDTMYNTIVYLYNSTCPNLTKISKLTDKRKTAINKFLKEFTVEDFQKICSLANKNSFLTGNNDRKWKADFDFLLRTDKATSILENKYNNENTKKLNNNYEQRKYENLDYLYVN